MILRLGSNETSVGIMYNNLFHILGSEKLNIPSTPSDNYGLISSDNYLLKDSNNLYLLPKEDN